jgi:uncharacterized cupredoxin-like copper-binding protein
MKGLNQDVSAGSRWLRRLAVLLLLSSGGCAAESATWEKAATVTVTMSEYHFAPARIELRRGVPYRLHLVNNGSELHEFTAPDFFRAAGVRNPRALVADGHEAVLRPGEAKDVFVVPLRAGTYKLSCADHEHLGMAGEIVVE